MADFWSIAIGLLGFVSLTALVAEYTDRRDHARYRRRQQDRVKGGGFIDHYGERN
jgi:hypothetical protein